MYLNLLSKVKLYFKCFSKWAGILLDSLISFAAISSAFWWASSGGFIKSVKANTTFVFPFIESIVSGILVLILLILTNQWLGIFSYSNNIYIFMSLASICSVCGVFLFILSIKKIPLGIAYTICASVQVLTAVFLDFAFNSLLPNSGVFIGGMIILLGILSINFFAFKTMKDKKVSFYLYIIGIFFSFVAGVVWSVGNFSNDRALIEANVLVGAMFRSFAPLLIFGPLLSLKFRNHIVIISRKDWSKILPGALCISIAMLSWLVSLNVNSVTLNSIFISMSPMFAILIGFIFFKEKIKLNELLGIFLCLSGTLMVIISK